MNKIYYLSTCTTCQRIMKALPLEQFELQDIKSQPLEPHQLEEMHKLTGNYESLFSRRAMKFRVLGLNEQQLTENDYRSWILKEYTFLKRPVVILEGRIFVGSSKKTIEQLHQFLGPST